MKAKGHLVVGAAAGVATIVAINRLGHFETKFEDIALGLIAGGLAGLVPDMLEPAHHPHHRSLFHGVIVLGLMIWAQWKIHSNPKLTLDQKKFLSVIASGYISHLAADGLTPMSLPLIA